MVYPTGHEDGASLVQDNPLAELRLNVARAYYRACEEAGIPVTDLQRVLSELLLPPLDALAGPSRN